MHALKLLVVGALLASGTQTFARDLRYVDGAELTLINKAMPTPDRYARIDTVKYDGFTDYQRRELVQHSAGLALAFKTDSREITVKPVFKLHSRPSIRPLSTPKASTCI